MLDGRDMSSDLPLSLLEYIKLGGQQGMQLIMTDDQMIKYAGFELSNLDRIRESVLFGAAGHAPCQGAWRVGAHLRPHLLPASAQRGRCGASVALHTSIFVHSLEFCAPLIPRGCAVWSHPLASKAAMSVCSST